MSTSGNEPLRAERGAEARTKEADLNYAIFVFATRCVAEGDFEALRRLGFEPADLSVIDQLRLTDLHALSASRAHALDIRVDRKALTWLIEHVRRRRTRETLKLELLRLDASGEMMANFFGMSSRAYTATREALGIASGQGRPLSRLADDDEEVRLWRLWILLAETERPHRLRHEDLWLIVGRELTTGLRVAWAIVQQWSRDEHSLQSFRDERCRYSDAQIEGEESALRHHHQVYRTGIAVGTLPAAPREAPDRLGAVDIARPNKVSFLERHSSRRP